LFTLHRRLGGIMLVETVAGILDGGTDLIPNTIGAL
jgi:hypothetical protein